MRCEVTSERPPAPRCSGRRARLIWPATLALLATWSAQGLSQELATSAPGQTVDIPRLRPVDMPPAEQVQAAVERGIQFLLTDQNRDGSWGTPERTKDLNIFAPVPGAHHAFRTAVTALCVTALLEVESGRTDVRQAVDRGEAWLCENLPILRRADPVALYNVWGHGYAVQALAALHRRHADDPARQEQLVALLRTQYDFLDRYESVDGGWGYYDFRAGTRKPATDSTSFVSAAVLVAFHEANQIGVAPPERLVQRAVDSLYRQQKPDFSYLYGEYLKYQPMLGINRPGGSLGRSQACNLALRLWGDTKITDQVLKDWLHRLFARNGWLSIGRKRPIPHEAWFQVAGYFYYFGHYYAALCIEQLPPAERPEFQAHLATVLLALQEADGSWWDYPLYNYHQQYGTAFALMSLRRCQTTP
ncbi:MAG: terpene cyclase/mutase family protein [Pirellulaceae bacterium]|nr:terpene cyclase/mutase family protein [Pirellulaceae bacterium]